MNSIKNSLYKSFESPARSQGVFGADKDRQPDDWKSEVKEAVMEAADVGILLTDSAGLAGKAEHLMGIGTAVTGAYFAYEGATMMKKAIKEKDAVGAVSASSYLTAATGQAGLTAGYLAGLKPIAAAVGPVVAAALQNPLVKTLSTGTFVLHGALEVGLGAREVYMGKKTHDKKRVVRGLLEMGMGAAVGAICLGAGLPAGIALVGLFGAQLWTDRKELADAARTIVKKVKDRFSPGHGTPNDG